MPQINSLGRFDVVISHTQFVPYGEDGKVYVSLLGTTPNGDTATGFLYFSETMVKGKGNEMIPLSQKNVALLCELGMDVAAFEAGQFDVAMRACDGAHASFTMDEEKDSKTKEVVPGKFRVGFVNSVKAAATNAEVKAAFAHMKFVLPATSKTHPPPAAAPAADVRTTRPAAPVPAFPGTDAAPDDVDAF